MGEVSYRPLIEAMTWSYSRLEIFDDCPYRWFLTYVHTPKLKKEDKFYAAYGLFMHDLLEKYYKGENSKEEILMMFLTQFKERTKGTGRPKAATVQKYFKTGTEFIKSLEPFRFKMVSVEEKIDLKILILGIFIFVQDQIRVGHIMISGHFSLIFPVGFCMNGLK